LASGRIMTELHGKKWGAQHPGTDRSVEGGVYGAVTIILAAGQVLADVPEGFATIATMKDKGIPRSKRILLSASFAIPVLSAAVFAYFVLRNQPEAFKLAALTFTAGLLTVAAIEDMVSEAHESGDDTHISPLAFIGGFVLFVLVSAGLEGVVSQS